ncbi:MAG: hypothetical protein IPL83_19975 [Bdellovibrionales bacterium]|nr:hypothetical protein [Bdellovibrionales bacterium]
MWQLGRPNTLWIGIFFLGIFFAVVAALSSAMVTLNRESFLKEISENGVITWSPESILSENGYILYHSPGMECHLLTMDGIRQGLVPGQLCKLLEDGSVVSTVADSENNNDIVKFNGSTVDWRFRATVTHDISVSPIDQSIWAKGLGIAKIGNKRKKVDYILGLSRQGEEIFRWSLDEHLKELSELLRPWGGLSSPYTSKKGDPYEGALNITHANAVQIIPPNKLEQSHPQFSAGNILVTEHHNGAAFIIDRTTRKIVWIHKGARLGLHSPRWLENGHILMFANDPLPNGNLPPASCVVEIDPITHETLWSFTEKPIGEMDCNRFGSAQRLRNGNTLISYGCDRSAIIEVTAQGSVVWKWRTLIGNEKLDTPFQIYRAEWLPKELVQAFFSSQR